MSAPDGGSSDGGVSDGRVGGGASQGGASTGGAGRRMLRLDTLGLVDEPQRWEEFGRWLVEQRERLGMKRREAARKAKLPESAWRDLETGRKEVVGGIKLLPNVSSEVLERVASTLEVPLDEVLQRVGRLPGGSNSSRSSRRTPEVASSRLSLVQKVSRLTYRDRRLVERLVDAMLEDEET